MPRKTAREQVATLIEVLSIDGWTITILPSTLSHAFRVEGRHDKHGNVTSANEGASLELALAPFEEELSEKTRLSLRAERGVFPPDRLHCGQLSNRLTSDIDWCGTCGALRVNGGEWTTPAHHVPTGVPGFNDQAVTVEPEGFRTTIERDEWGAQVWVLSDEPEPTTKGETARKARAFFGAPTDAPVMLIKPRPETPQEIEKYKPNAQLWAVKFTKPRNDGEPGSTPGSRRSK